MPARPREAACSRRPVDNLDGFRRYIRALMFSDRFRFDRSDRPPHLVLPPCGLGQLGWLLREVKGQVVALAVLPRGDSAKLAAMCPPRCAADGAPFTSYVPSINKVNTYVKKI